MKIVKLSFNFKFPIFRQTPGNLGVWGDYKFLIDDSLLECDYWVIYSDYNLVMEKCKCPKENIFFIPAECFNTSNNFPKQFLAQFGKIITVQKQITGFNVIYNQNANPWFVEKSYDELLKLKTPVKSKLISIISSNKLHTPGHKKRLHFALKLKDYFGDQIDLFGRGIQDFDEKYSVLAPYKYSIAIENDFEDDWMTEKVIDPILTYTMPIYFGCPNLDKYLSDTSYLRIDIDDFENSVKIIEDALSKNKYDIFFDNVLQERHNILNNLQLFPMLVSFFDLSQDSLKKLNNTIYPVNHFENNDFKIKIYKMFSKIKNRFFLKENKNDVIQSKRCDPWFKINGDKTLRLNYDLNENSIVFDIGGYKGEFAGDIFCKYGCHIYIFEPIMEYYTEIKNKFINNSKIKVFPFGLGMKDSSELISFNENSSSLFRSSEKQVLIQIKSLNGFIEDNNIFNIDLMKINIEGAEYDLLDSLISKNNHSIVQNFQIQFHDFVFSDGKERMFKIHSELVKSHSLSYQYEFVWENWKKNTK
jgi:FkbM family methyltransferase